MATVAAVAVSSTLGAMVLASRSGLPDPGDLTIGLGRLLLQRNVPLRFAPLSPRILLGSLGPGLLERAPGDGGRPPRPGHGDHEPPEGEEEDPPLPEQLTAAPRVVVALRVDREIARPGDVLTYTIVVTNKGDGIARQLEIESHVPPHTTLVSGWECGGQPASVTPNPHAPGGYTICVSVPGPPAPGPHGIRIVAGNLGPGSRSTFRFKVAIDADAPSGTRILNHAHVSGHNFPRRTSNDVSTRVA